MRKILYFIIILIVLDLFILGFFFFKMESEKQKLINNFENQKNQLVYDLGYVVALFARDKILSESFPENVRNYLNELVRSDKNLELILIADSSGKVLFSTNVAYENKQIDEIFSENITSLVDYELKSNEDKVVLNMPISEFNRRILYLRIEYKRR
ncbi:MAG: hypothetical protein RQ990_03135 [Candidatus Hydrothermia bacterium]|jgi:hypothetical protein|nr:hypothetical protein [Candidatus Hydrothermia bacterium]